MLDKKNKNNISNITIINGCQPFVTEDGYVIPLLLFEPIYINGHIFKNQVIYTWDEFEKINPKLNDRVTVVPGKNKKYTLFNLDARTTDDKHIPISKPTLCPECEKELKAVGSDLYCTNYECPTADIRRVLRYLYFCCVHLDIVYRDLVTVCKHGYIKDLMGLYTTHPSIVHRHRNLPVIAENEKWFDPISKEKINGHTELEEDITNLNKELTRNRKCYKMLNEIVSVENTSRTPRFKGKTFIVGKTSFFSPDYYCVFIALNGGNYIKDYPTLPLEKADFILGDLENEEERNFKKIKNSKTMPKKITESMFRSLIPMLYARSTYKIRLVNSRNEYLALVGNNE